VSGEGKRSIQLSYSPHFQRARREARRESNPPPASITLHHRPACAGEEAGEEILPAPSRSGLRLHVSLVLPVTCRTVRRDARRDSNPRPPAPDDPPPSARAKRARSRGGVWPELHQAELRASTSH